MIGRGQGRLAGRIAAVLGYVVAGTVALVGVAVSGLDGATRSALASAVAGRVVALAVLAGLLLVGLVALLSRLLGDWPRAVRRLADDVRVLLGANPEHRLEVSGPPELAALAGAVTDLAERRGALERDVEVLVREARADVEQERNRLAAVMSDLTVAVLVCSPGGRVLLYNAAARSLLDDDPALGLGRSVFGIVDRGLVTHALDRIADGHVDSHVSTLLRDGTLLSVRLAPVRSQPSQAPGFVLLLEDTRHAMAVRRREAVLRALTESTRAATAGIRAAVETLLDYPDMDPQERAQFLRIAAEESQRLGTQVEGWAAEASDLASDELLADMRGDDLVTVLVRELSRSGGLSASAGTDPGELWLRADSHALAGVLCQLARHLAGRGVEQVVLSLAPEGRHARLDLSWAGPVLAPQQVRAWLDEPPVGGAASCVREVVERHDAEVWALSGDDGAPGLRLLLPMTQDAPRERAPALGVESRPEYDFDLFDLPEDAAGWHDRRLSELTYAVFDTETTGFAPDRGDEIVAVGAVRVVGGRLRRNEVFERLVDPRRPVPASSTAVHGITTQMVQGQPPLEEVLPVFARFCDGMVLVGHNVGFDLSFLRAAESRTGVRLSQPVLDTLLLDAAVHPDHDEHSLEATAARLGVDITGRHTALGDALVTGEVFVRLLALLSSRGVVTLGEALDASRATYQARLDARLYGGGTTR